jgi:serine/threonine-protein kinase ATR
MEENLDVIASLRQPKRVAFISTRGERFQYLVKRDDDLRKDMRMMEFVRFVNGILNRDRQCRQRDLSIPIFSVVCLNEKCGIIEWVEHTCALRIVVEHLLTEKGCLIPVKELKDLMIEGNELRDPIIAERRYANFVNVILPRMPPVLHLWQIACFRGMSQWIQSRMTYTRSVAVWSMVGYVLGLGDRHTENVLLNEKTGSCLHVDFSCLFDKAMTLPIPETVPFRLTQNLIDGMGIIGTEGTFSAAAKLVMETLRTKKQKVIAVLHTFVNDPLVEWQRGNREVKASEKTAEYQAKLTLREIERRLSGLAEDRSAVRSPECVVRGLIAQATDPKLLSQMYVGWQPYL